MTVNYLWLERSSTSHAAPTRLRVEGRHFINEAGQPVPLRSHSAFLGLLRYQCGQDVRPFMRYVRDVTGSNCLRTFVLMAYVPAQNGLPTLTPDRTMEALDGYLSLAAEEGLYVDLTAGDAQVVLPEISRQTFFFRQVGEIMQAHPNAALLGLNEPWKNGMDPYSSLNLVSWDTLRTRGARSDEGVYDPPLDVYTVHTQRSLNDEGYKWVRHQWEQHWLTARPVYHEEPMGCAEYTQDGKRDNEPVRFAQGSLVGEMSGAGWCFHCDYGIQTVLPIPGSRQDQCARVVGAARRWMKPEAQRWHETRAGLNDSALVLDDAHALRVYMRLGTNEGQAVAVHPQGYVAQGQNGWTVVKQDGYMVDLVR